MKKLLERAQVRVTIASILDQGQYFSQNTQIYCQDGISGRIIKCNHDYHQHDYDIVFSEKYVLEFERTSTP